MLRDRRDMNRTPALEYRPGSMQAANRVEHFEICVETMIEMIEPGLGVTRAPYASRQGAVDRCKCGIKQALASLLRKSRVVAGDKEAPSAARQLDTVARRPPAHLDASRIANARLTLTLTCSGDIRRRIARAVESPRRWIRENRCGSATTIQESRQAEGAAHRRVSRVRAHVPRRLRQVQIRLAIAQGRARRQTPGTA